MRTELIRDPRLRILAALVLAFGFSTLQGPLALVLMVFLTVCIVMIADLSPRHLGRALRLPGLVVAGLVLVLPFSSGATVLAQFGPFTMTREGLSAAVAIVLRFTSIFTTTMVFLGTMPVPQLIRGLRGLGLPDLMVDMALLTLRFMGDLRQDLARMQLAQRLRGGAMAGHWYRTSHLSETGWILASLLLRSYARSERVYRAMILRGHGAAGPPPPDFMQACRADKLWVAFLLVLAGALFAIDRVA